ncbi:Animal-type fatty acid synthase and related proteins [Ceraceosorus bombacis]|uniref:Animal-type fatty acid synthase and related proteins n=1 Tax=Ceraceosorus bombacis TaxID=401625 RepID=A0A0P1BJ77_9BASI|nr:Animal-type fatty acid synthase and related proteins [Ceraceosorus bombacis]
MPGVLDTNGAAAPSQNGNGYTNGMHAGASDGHASKHADEQHSLQNGHLPAWREEPIAVIGMACMLPGEVGGGNVDVKGLWNMLLEQKSGVKAYPGRFNRDLHVGTSVGKALSDKGGFLTDTDLFDPLEFGIGPSEASRMSGTARMMLEMAFLALYDSGIDYRGSRTACFGIASGSPLAMQGEEHEINEHTAQGQAYSLLSNRVSFLLDLRGPTMTVDSACSTGLTALHLASESIRRGEVDTAVVVGANLTMDWTSTVAFSQSGVLSPDGICRSLDDKASGYVRSEACGAIVLRRADVARKAGDRIHANILATAIGSNGRNQSQAAPSGPAQMRIIDETYAKIGRKPSEVDYVELHATGTKVGDPIEANAAGKTYSQGRQGRELVVGTLKANTGHTEWVSGIMSLIKVCHMLRTGIVPPQPNLETPSRAIDWASWNMRAPTSAEPLGKGGKEKSIISIQSYGFGGATGHAIIEAVAGQQTAPASTSNQASFFSLCFAGGLTPRSASAVSSEAAAQLQAHSLDVAALARQTRSMPCRSFALVESETGRLVTAFSKPRNLAPTTFATEPKLLFILSGQGPQHFHMGRSLYRDFAAFRESIQASDRVYTRVTGRSLLQETQLFQWSPSAKSETLEGSTLWPASIVFTSICMVQIALFDLLKSFGVLPNAIQLDELLLQAAQRGGDVDVAAYNADGAFSISGSAERVDAVVKSAQDSGIFARALRTESPMHSAAIQAAKDVFIQTIDDIWARYDAQITSPQLPLFSTVTGKRVDRRQDAQYMWSNSREAVQFVAAVRSAQAFLGGESEAAQSYTTIELSPHPVLSAYLGELGVEHIVPVMERRNKAPTTCPADTQAFVKAVATLFVSGHKTVQYHSLLYADPAESKDEKSVIAFPWKKTHWPGDVRPGWSSLADHPPLYAPDAAEFKISCATHPELAEHKVNGARIIPGAAFLETGLELDSSINVISGGELLGAMPIVEARERPIEVKVQRDGATYLITSRSGGSLIGPSKPHFKGNAYAVDPQTLSRPPRKNFAQILSRFEKHIDQETFYTLVAGTAEFNGAFRRINKWSGKDGESLAYLDGLRPNERQAYRVHPCVIDAALHSCAADFAKFLSHNGAETVETILPRAFDRVTVYDANLARPTLISHVRRTKYAPQHLTYDMDICDEEGEVLITFESVHCRKYTTQPVEPITKRYDMEWQPADLLPLDLAPPASVAPPPSREELFEALDQLCIESLARHMPSQPPSADASIDRKRYYAMAQRALARPQRSTHFQPSPGTSEEWTVYTEMIRRLDSVLADVFASNTASLPVLFAHNDDLMSRAYKAMALHDRTYELFASVFGDFLKQCAAQGKHVVRVLEVGAGTGQLTRYLNSVVQQLATSGTSEKPAVEFVITDVNVQLAAEAASTLTQDSGVTPAAFNLFTGQSGLTKASDRHSFDFICMSNVLHIAANLPTAMVNLQKYMAPGAMVGVVEMDGRVNETQAPGALFIDYIFGSFKDWFGMEDHREHPTQSAGAWHSFFSQHMDRVALVEPAHEPTLSRNLALFYQDCGEYAMVEDGQAALVSDDAAVSAIANGLLLAKGWAVPKDQHDKLDLLIRLTSTDHRSNPLHLEDGVGVELDCNIADASVAQQGQHRIGRFVSVNVPLLVSRSPVRIGRVLSEWLPLALSTAVGETLSLDSTSTRLIADVEKNAQTMRHFAFDPLATYVLLGGCGGLGAGFASEMYNLGARHIVLTSRTGPARFERGDMEREAALIRYLQSVPDLNLELVACDAMDESATRALFERLTNVRGIIWMPLSWQVSIAIPIVLGAGQFARWTQSVIDAQGGKIPGWLIQAAAKTGISFTMQSVLHQIIDSINVRKQRKVNLYIPHVDTRLVTDMLGPNNAFARHLDLRTASEKASLPGANGALDQSSNPVDRVISQALCIPSSDIDDDTPLSSYGLDSLSAVRLSSMLRTVGVTMTQMQLLGNATPNKIKALAVTSSPAPQ